MTAEKNAKRAGAAIHSGCNCQLQNHQFIRMREIVRSKSTRHDKNEKIILSESLVSPC
jgi:hypothetical protein